MSNRPIHSLKGRDLSVRDGQLADQKQIPPLQQRNETTAIDQQDPQPARCHSLANKTSHLPEPASVFSALKMTWCCDIS